MRKIALILCTLGRHEETLTSLKSINDSIEVAEGTWCSLVVVDQNPDRVLNEAVNTIEFNDRIELLYCNVDFRGLSRARNYGLSRLSCDVEGFDLISFPDDDCIYSADVLDNALSFLDVNKNIDFVTVQTKDLISGGSLVPVCDSITQVTQKNIRGCSFTFFFKGRCFSAGLRFNEVLGVGSGTRYGSAEEEDLILKLISQKFFGVSIPGIFVFHPAKEENCNRESLLRNFRYSGGKAYCLLNNREMFTRFEMCQEVSKPLLRLSYLILEPKRGLLAVAYAIGFYLSLVSLIRTK